MTRTKEYRFLDKDPIIDLIRTAYQQKQIKLSTLAADAHVTPQTISRWLYGDTKRPQNYTIHKVLTALGVETRYYWSGTNSQVEILSQARLRKFKRTG